MFAVIYRGFIHPEREKEYQSAWRLVAHYFVTERGALGSTLHKTEKGEWLAYSRWPTRALRDAAWLSSNGVPQEINAAIHTLKECIDSTKPYEEIFMEVMDELLLPGNATR